MSLFTVLFIAFTEDEKNHKKGFQLFITSTEVIFLLIDSHNIQDATKEGK